MKGMGESADFEEKGLARIWLKSVEMVRAEKRLVVLRRNRTTSRVIISGVRTR